MPSNSRTKPYLEFTSLQELSKLSEEFSASEARPGEIKKGSLREICHTCSRMSCAKCVIHDTLLAFNAEEILARTGSVGELRDEFKDILDGRAICSYRTGHDPDGVEDPLEFEIASIEVLLQMIQSLSEERKLGVYAKIDTLKCRMSGRYATEIGSLGDIGLRLSKAISAARAAVGETHCKDVQKCICGVCFATRDRARYDYGTHADAYRLTRGVEHLAFMRRSENEHRNA